jgi:uncharacterized protein YciI
MNQPDPTRFLAKDVYVIVTRQVDPTTPIAREMMQAHLSRQVQVEKAGIMFAAGPMFTDGAQAPEAGMIIVRAGSFAEADAIAAADPLHKAGLREYTLRRWRINEGSYTVTVNYSDQTMRIE